MHRFISLICAVSAAALLVVGCGSDSNSGSPSTGGSSSVGGSSGGGNSDVQCVGDYAALTHDVFASAVSTTGMCAPDVDTICAVDVTAKAEACGLACLSSGSKDMDGCVSTCLNGKVSPALSAGCTSCYTTDVGCARDNCELNCISPSSTDCMTCRQKFGCIDAFYSCSGLPVPGATSSGGSGGSGGSTAEAGAGG
jgi:hypothetical protein